MGTRSLICVFYKGRFVVAQYAQWDGYPEGEGQGFKILKFLLVSANIECLKDGLEHVYMPNREELLQIEKEIAIMDGHSFHMKLDECWPSLSRNTGAGILEIIARAKAEEPVSIQLDLEFANDSNCEWAYVVDLDHGMFEVFAGAEGKGKVAGHRFHDIGGEGVTVPTFVKGFPVAELPPTEKEFITALNKALSDIEEERQEKWRKRKQASVMTSTVFSSRTLQWMTDTSKCIRDSKLGLLGALWPELREIIYEYVFSVDPLSHGKSKTGLGLLRVSTIVYEEAIPLLYRSRLLGIIFGPNDDRFQYRSIKWGDTEFSWEDAEFHCGRCIRSLPANFFDLVQNLQVCFTDGESDDLDSDHNFNLQKGILQLCNSLRDSTQLRYLDISIHFICNFEDISDMACMIEPIKMLRGIQNPTITIYGYQLDQPREPRWDLTEEYANYLRQLLTSPHGTPGFPADGIEVFEDFFASSESADENIDPNELAHLSVDPELEETMISAYLQDVYNTKDRTALEGGLGEDQESDRWMLFLKLVREELDEEIQDLSE